MSYAKQMLDAHPRDFNVDADVLARCIDACHDCAQACSACADSCLAESDVQTMAKCIRGDLDCADVCEATGRIIGRQTEYDANVTRTILDACIAACRSCGEECESHAAHMAHCRVCAEACRQCEEACAEVVAAMK